MLFKKVTIFLCPKFKSSSVKSKYFLALNSEALIENIQSVTQS